MGPFLETLELEIDLEKNIATLKNIPDHLVVNILSDPGRQNFCNALRESSTLRLVKVKTVGGRCFSVYTETPESSNAQPSTLPLAKFDLTNRSIYKIQPHQNNGQLSYLIKTCKGLSVSKKEYRRPANQDLATSVQRNLGDYSIRDLIGICKTMNRKGFTEQQAIAEFQKRNQSFLEFGFGFFSRIYEIFKNRQG